MRQRGKQFLSESHQEGGTISWSVITISDSSSVLDYPVEAEIKLTDCYKQINLDFDCVEVKHIKKRVDKLDRLLVELNKMKEALLLAEKELAPKKFYY